MIRKTQKRGKNRVKCPVCDKENKSMLCPQCGYDSSRDYGRYPTFGSVGRGLTASALRGQWEAKQPAEPEAVPKLPEPPAPSHKRASWIAGLAFAGVLVLGIGIGSMLGGEKPAEPESNVQMQAPPETTTEPGVQVQVPPETSGVQGGAITLDDSGWQNNVLKEGARFSDYVYGTDIRKEDVQSVKFLDSKNDAPEDAVDVSVKGDGSVLLWAVGNDLYYAADGGINARESCANMFESFNNLKTIDFGGNLHTEEADDMFGMFAFCGSLTSLDLSSFDTRNVEDMNSMFSACVSLTSLDLSNFDTRNVHDMNGMFSQCFSLTSLDVSSFNTENVQSMIWMFGECSSLMSLDLSSFDTGNADTRDMFSGCPAGDDWQHLLH